MASGGRIKNSEIFLKNFLNPSASEIKQPKNAKNLSNVAGLMGYRMN
jgi:hypothetical protein